MSKLEELIQKLCPNGVEYKTLGEIAVDIYRGAGITRDQVTNEGIPCVRYGEIYTTYGVWFDHCISHTDETRIASKKYFEHGDVLFAITGESVEDIAKSCVYIGNEKCLAGGDIVVLKHNEEPKYIGYVLETSNARRQKSAGKVKSKVVHSSVPAIRSIVIPVPPLEVQREIVRVLDSFTLLTAELTAELTARKKQYEFYRDKLLTFDNDIKILPLGKVCDLQAGKAIKAAIISDTETVATPIPCYGANGRRGYVATYNQEGEKSIIGRQGALCGNVCYATGKYYATEHAVVVTDKGYFNSRYLFHVLTHADLNQYKTAGAQPGLSVSRLNEVRIAVPDKNVQDKIANVLDNFETICTDLNIGLPAEIEARQKQYEYYRDLLLTFAEKGDMLLTDGPIRSELSTIKLIRYVFGYSYVTLDKISENCDRQRKPVTKGKRDIGAYPYYGASGIVDYVSDYIFDGEYLLISEDGANLLARKTPIAFSISGKIWVNNHAHVLKFETYELRRYVEIYLNSIDLSKYISGGAQPKLNQENLNKIMIPLPSNERIKGIVDILDRFDALCNDLSAGLPAEIEARKKQYEYYRDKLLNFKEVK